MAEFLEDNDAEGLTEQNWSHFSRQHIKTGFREGAEQAQDNCRQKGFNVGFSHCAVDVCNWAYLRGVICGIHALIHLTEGEERLAGLVHLGALQEEVNEEETRILPVAVAKAEEKAEILDQHIVRQVPDARNCDEHQLCLCKLHGDSQVLADRISSVLAASGVMLPK